MLISSEVSFHLKHFLLGDFSLVKPCKLRYDLNMTLKEDYDYVLQHITKEGGVMRFNCILPHIRHYDNPGGAVTVRNPEEEEKNIKYLLRKWPTFIKRNSRRPNEVLLKVK